MASRTAEFLGCGIRLVPAFCSVGGVPCAGGSHVRAGTPQGSGAVYHAGQGHAGLNRSGASVSPQVDLHGANCAKGGVAVEHRDADLGFRDLPVEVSRHQGSARRLMRFILLCTRLRRWCPLHRRQMVRPSYRDVSAASLRATAPALVGLRGCAFLRGGMTE